MNKDGTFATEGASLESYANASYFIAISDDNVERDYGGVLYSKWYNVVNKVTGVTEWSGPVLPEALYYAYAYDHSLRTKQYIPKDEREDKLQLVKPTRVN